MPKIEEPSPEYTAELQKMEAQAREVAGVLDRYLNGDKQGSDREFCFALLITKFGGPGQPATYISNGDRSDMIHTVEEWLERMKSRT